MNSVITFFVGCAAFAVMMLVKIPIKIELGTGKK